MTVDVGNKVIPTSYLKIESRRILIGVEERGTVMRVGRGPELKFMKHLSWPGISKRNIWRRAIKESGGTLVIEKK